MGFALLITEFRAISNRILEYHHFEENCEQVGVVFDRIMGSSDPEVIVDQVGNLSAAKETVLFLGLLFLQTDFPFEM